MSIKTILYRYPYWSSIVIIVVIASIGCILPLLLGEETLEACDQQGRTPLITAAEEGDQDEVVALLRKGAIVESTDNCRWTALLKAAANGHVEIVQQLLDVRAYIDHRDKAGYPAFAVVNGRSPVVKLLLERGANVEFTDDTLGWNALIWAARDGRAEMARQLVTAGSPLDVTDRDGNTALMWAARTGHTATVATLLEAGANPELVNNEGKSATALATMRNHDAIARELKSH